LSIESARGPVELEGDPRDEEHDEQAKNPVPRRNSRSSASRRPEDGELIRNLRARMLDPDLLQGFHLELDHALGRGAYPRS
jgi:hypothetical protein